MNIIFMGTPAFAVPSLEKLLNSTHKISAVVTTLDKPGGRGLKLSESEIKKVAKKHGLKIFQPESLKDENFIKEIKNLEPDLIVVVAFRILPKEVFTIPRYGSINLHASLLPKYRGAAPINWAIIKGEKETGVTTFFLREKVDTGNIILQNKYEITDEDDAGSLHDKLAHLGADTVFSTVNLIEKNKGNIPVYTQDDSLATPAPKITPDFCKINWNDTIRNVYNFIRGLSPHPAAYTFHNGNRVKIFKTKLSTTDDLRGAEQQEQNDLPGAKRHDNPLLTEKLGSPGQISMSNNRILASCSDGFLEILELQLEGKKRLPANELIRGYKIQNGGKFK